MKEIADMKYKGIRKILIEYLKAFGSEMRIYQEKTIGACVCDHQSLNALISVFFSQWRILCTAVWESEKTL